MKHLIILTCVTAFIAGCINSSTAFTNRSVAYQVTPELIGEHSAVTGSPTANDATVNAEKTFETSTKANVAQQLTDTSSNDQSKRVNVPEEKKEEAPEQK